MKYIPKDFIFDLVARTNIVDVISQRVKIKKKGNNYFGCCPFHNEKTASFSVSDKKQIFYCFGCGASGSVIDFIMEFDRLSFVETIEELANLHALTVPYANGSSDKNKTLSANNIRADLYSLLNSVANFYHQKLYTPEAAGAREYLKKRGLDQAIIQRFNLGYSPDSWNETHKTLANNPTLLQLYDQAGMLVTNDNQKQYDRFRGRIMFPIRDRRGNVIAFGGRTIKADDNVKYLNSPETNLFHKGRQLYGLYEALEKQRNPTRLLVVEGYMDVVALAQYGIDYAVAALGTATTDEHIKLLFRTTDNIIFCYDGDNAGRRAAWRALNTLLPSMMDGKQINFVFLPEGEDPDSMVRKEGKVAFEQRLADAQPLSNFLFEGLLKQADISTLEGKAKLSNIAIPMINLVQAENFNQSLRRRLGDYLGLLDSIQINGLFSQSPRNTSDQPSIATQQPMELKLTTMRILIGLLLQYPELAKTITDKQSIGYSTLPGTDIFLKLLAICDHYPDITTAQLLSEFDQAENKVVLQHLKTLAVWEHRYDEHDIAMIFTDTLKALYDNILAQRQEALIAKARITGLNEQEKKELSTLLVLLKKG
ncbi:DNA primase [Candidatus Schmidhempelia bombi]|jgi:DNA primase|uniref:DNA primase n=1 Tax=Candidatus Schmidhempelia bombi str. Bimp TaxID=1387197 RepID=A0AB94IF73_9GAMM|nr:DNA primase [Candidatus Schmidhempelia bombi]TEA28161.1 DNA primase [Candidatus Schmidhempelia bombi str. Bimp]